MRFSRVQPTKPPVSSSFFFPPRQSASVARRGGTSRTRWLPTTDSWLHPRRLICAVARRGASVVVTGLPVDEAHLRDLGGAEVIDYSAADLPARVRACYPNGVDGLIDLVNWPANFAPDAELVATRGRLATILGAADPEQPTTRSIAATNIQHVVDAATLARLAELAGDGTQAEPTSGQRPLSSASPIARPITHGSAGRRQFMPRP